MRQLLKNRAKHSKKRANCPKKRAKAPKRRASRVRVRVCDFPRMATNIDSEILWGTFRDLERKYSIPRSSGYVLIQQGAIRSKLIRHKGQRGCGRRLIDMRSVEEFLNGCPERPSAKVSRDMTARGFASADARAARAQNGGEG